MKTAILVDGGFYRKRAKHIWGDRSPKDRADELIRYCQLHIKDAKDESRSLYRILYYDCPPMDGLVFDPLSKKNVDLTKSPTYIWTMSFFAELLKRRKVAIRKGALLSRGRGYAFTTEATKSLLAHKLKLEDVSARDLTPVCQQKGVDMKIGIDIVHLAYRHLVDQIILITGDSDFVPAAKIARVEGIDVVLDSMGAHVTDNLAEHVDGMFSHWRDSRISTTTNAVRTGY